MFCQVLFCGNNLTKFLLYIQKTASNCYAVFFWFTQLEETARVWRKIRLAQNRLKGFQINLNLTAISNCQTCV